MMKRAGSRMSRELIIIKKNRVRSPGIVPKVAHVPTYARCSLSCLEKRKNYAKVFFSFYFRSSVEMYEYVRINIAANSFILVNLRAFIIIIIIITDARRQVALDSECAREPGKRSGNRKQTW